MSLNSRSGYLLLLSLSSSYSATTRPYTVTTSATSTKPPFRELDADSWPLPLMCVEHYTNDCPACGKDYLIFVEFCKDFHPPLLYCSNGTSVNRIDMLDGGCPSPICPNSRNGGCSVM